MTDAPENPEDRAAAPPADPWRSFGAVMALTLFLDAIVVLLAIPVVGAVGGGLTTVSLVYPVSYTHLTLPTICSV